MLKFSEYSFLHVCYVSMFKVLIWVRVGVVLCALCLIHVYTCKCVWPLACLSFSLRPPPPSPLPYPLVSFFKCKGETKFLWVCLDVMRPLKNAPPLPGGIFSLTPSRRDHNSHFRRARAITIFWLTDGVFTAGDLGGVEDFENWQTDFNETFRVYRKIIEDTGIFVRFPKFEFWTPLPPLRSLKFRFFPISKKTALAILLKVI